MKHRHIVSRGVFIAASLLLFGVIVTPSVLANSELVTHWRFDEPATGATALDSSGSGFHGTPHGMQGGMNDDDYLPEPSTDVPPVTFSNPRSLFFKGDGGNSTGSYIDVSNWNIDTTDGFTVSLWAKPETVDGSAWQRFIDFGDGPSNENIVFAQESSSSSVFFEVYDGGNTTKITGDSGTWKVGEWHYYAATVDADGNATVYVDGEVVASGQTNKPKNVTRANKYIGKSNWGDDYYQGYMDDLRFYNRALTQEEVEALTDGDEGPGVPVDNNGIDEGVEDAAPNNGDANNDGTPDSQQGNVASFISTPTGKYVSVQTPSDCTLSQLSTNAASQNTATDPEYTYPAGFVDFTASCGTPGYTADIVLYFYGQTADKLILRKYNPNTQTYSTIQSAAINQVSTSGHSVTRVAYQVTDGGELDADGTANGVIVDPVGLALGATLAETGTPQVLLTLLASALILSGAVLLRKRSAQQ